MIFNPYLKPALHEELPKYTRGEKIYPINVEISPTDKCNASCDWCFYSGSGDREELEYQEILEVIASFLGCGIKAVTWSGGGEPTMYNKFKYLISIIESLEDNIEQGLFTNGLKVNYNPELLDWIRVSKSDKPWNIKSLEKIRRCKKVGMCINYTGSPKSLKSDIQTAQDLCFDYVQIRPALKTKGETVKYESSFIVNSDIQVIISDYKFSESSKKRRYTKCEGYHFVPFIWANGDVDTCAYHRGDKRFNLGNIYKQSFKEIMDNAPDYVDVIPECQVCCKNHEINNLIHDLRSLTDINFI